MTTPRAPSTGTVGRHDEIARIRADLERGGFPRLQMLLLVTLTGASGFVASYALLHGGMLDMWLRYLAAFGIAYLAFLALLWLWLRTRAEDYADLPDPTDGVPTPRPGHPDACFAGKGGESGGGGASGSFDAPGEPVSAPTDAVDSLGEALGTAAEAEEFAIPLVVLILAAAMVASSLLVVYSAPTLFAELLLDGVLSATLYRRLRGLETRHWLETAIRRTALPFALTAIAVSAAGWAMAIHAPGAHSIGDVVFQSRLER
ncbi:MAG TPA: hypothetical protein VF816_10360 [Rhodocyclaceae bacterium]